MIRPRQASAPVRPRHAVLTQQYQGYSYYVTPMRMGDEEIDGWRAVTPARHWVENALGEKVFPLRFFHHNGPVPEVFFCAWVRLGRPEPEVFGFKTGWTDTNIETFLDMLERFNLRTESPDDLDLIRVTRKLYAE